MRFVSRVNENRFSMKAARMFDAGFSYCAQEYLAVLA